MSCASFLGVGSNKRVRPSKIPPSCGSRRYLVAEQSNEGPSTHCTRSELNCMTNVIKESRSQQFSGVKSFPAGLPKPHLARDWGRSLETALTEKGLTDVARKEMPPGLFPKLWSPQALEEPPALPDGASFGDQMKWRSMRDEIEKRRSHNAHVKEQREDWWLKKNHGRVATPSRASSTAAWVPAERSTST